MSRTLRVLSSFALAVVLVAPSVYVSAQAGSSKTAPAGVIKALQGEWVVATINGESLATGGTEMSLTFTGDKYAQTVNGTVNERGTFKIDTTKKPITIDLAISEGSDAGKLQLGVLELAGDTLTVHLNLPNAPARPADFTPQGQILVVAKKRK